MTRITMEQKTPKFIKKVIKKPSVNIVTQLAGKAGKTYLVEFLKSSIEEKRERVTLHSLDTFEKRKNLNNTVNNEILVKNETCNGKLYRIDLRQFDSVFADAYDNWQLPTKKYDSYIYDVPSWATLPFHQYVMENQIIEECRELGISFNVHIPVDESNNMEKNGCQAEMIQKMYGYKGVDFFWWSIDIGYDEIREKLSTKYRISEMPNFEIMNKASRSS